MKPIRGGINLKNLNNLISEFKSQRSDRSFEEIYAEVTKEIIGSKDGNPYFRQVARSMKADVHDVKAVFDDTLLNAIAKFQSESGHDFLRYFKSSWRRRRANLPYVSQAERA
jgi:uncharacterized protein YbcV (DUF1398 family)